MTYIILSPQLGDMGGSQMYVCNKSIYMKARGWNVKLVYFTESELLIKRFEEFERHCVPELAWGIQYYCPRRVKEIVRKLAATLKSDDHEVVIESSLFHLAFWGELLARELKAKHILHLLEEDVLHFSSRVADFMEWKLERWEFMNASEKKLRLFFRSRYKPRYKDFEFTTDFFCSNVSQEEDCPDGEEVSFAQADETILSIGRLDKPYIQEMVNQVLVYADAHRDRCMNMVFIGASPDGSAEQKIEKAFADHTNVRIYLLGYKYPVPASIVKQADVAIATSNSVQVSYNQGVPTISVDANDHFAIGLYGVDTWQMVFRNDERQVPISDYLEKVLVRKEFPRQERVVNDKSELEILDAHFRGQAEFIQRRAFDDQYYRIERLYSPIEILRGLAVRFIAGRR